MSYPCLFTVHKLDTAKSLLSYVEDIGIDAAGFWQNLFYTRFPGSYEQTRDNNPIRRRGISSSDKTSTAEYYIDLYEAILSRPLVVPKKRRIHPIDKNIRATVSDVQAI